MIAALKRKAVERVGIWKARRRASALLRKYDASTFDKVESFLLFVGCGRSGHTLLGAIVDAHEQALISNEIDVLKFIKAGFSRDALFSLIEDNSRRVAADGSMGGGGYSYAIADQWQGRSSNLRIIGDKKGGVSSQRLAADPTLLLRLQGLVSKPVRIIHVVRNPFDNIATMTMRGSGKNVKDSARKYFLRCQTVASLQNANPDLAILHVRHEELINQPQQTIGIVCRFLDLPVTDSYLNACESAIYKTPNKSRKKLNWDMSMVSHIESDICRFDFLKGYSFGN